MMTRVQRFLSRSGGDEDASIVENTTRLRNLLRRGDSARRPFARFSGTNEAC
jgi:hypothetical protein